MEESRLRFSNTGKFKILIFADCQDDETLEETTRLLMCQALDTYCPELVIFLGDNTVAKGYENQYAAVEALTKPVRDRSVPFAMVFGNHDQEQGVSKEKLLEIYKSFGCLTYNAHDGIYGTGNCNLPVYSFDGKKISFNLWLIDSGSNNTVTPHGGYDFIRESQLEWYRKTAAELKRQNGGKAVPAINFQHIVIPEIYEHLYYKAPFSKNPKTTFMGVTYSDATKISKYSGLILERACPPRIYDGQLDAWRETGDVIAAFCGHDHTNSFRTFIRGIENINVPTAGCYAYSTEITRGFGVLTLYEDYPKSYDYELVHLYDMALKKDSEILKVCGLKQKAEILAGKAVHGILTACHAPFINNKTKKHR